MNIKRKIHISFGILVAVTTILYLFAIYYGEINAMKDPDYLYEPGMKIVFYFLMSIPIYLAEVDLLLAGRSLLLRWSKSNLLTKGMNVISMVLSVVTLCMMTGLVIEECFRIRINDRLIYLVGIPISLEIGLRIIRFIIFCIERIVRIIRKSKT